MVGFTREAAVTLTREAATSATFGWHRTTLGLFAGALALPTLAARGSSPAAPLALEAVCARVVDRFARDATLGRFQAVSDRPGLVRALARTLHELRLASATATSIAPRDPDLARIFSAYVDELARTELTDRAELLRVATHRVNDRGAPHALLDRPLLLLDLAITGRLEAALIGAIASRATSVLATAPTGDARTLAHLVRALGTSPEEVLPEIVAGRSLPRLQTSLFQSNPIAPAPLADDVTIVSAPGESRECVEIARLVHREAEGGVPFDRMAIALRAPTQYRPHLEEALRRASVPAHFAEGSVKPDPSGRAFLTLLACAAEQLSARRFAEYLSLGEVPDADVTGAPPEAQPSHARWVPPDVEIAAAAVLRDDDDHDDEDDTDRLLEPPANAPATTPVVAGSLRAPRRWERMLVDAAVIGGRDRWARRLAGLRAWRVDELTHLPPEEPRAAGLRRSIDELDALTAFAMPLLDVLAALPATALWSEWLDVLAALATRSLRRPHRALAVLAELAPMGVVGPVDLHEVRLVLEPRLRDLVLAPMTRRHGKVFVAPIESLRGLAFDVVFVPGLAEKLFPPKVAEDPILLDDARRALSPELQTNVERVSAERRALHLAVGAASRRLVLSYPRLDAEQSRPRVPSFYGLEVLRAIEGSLTGFEELARRAEHGGAARIAWPSPRDAHDAIDDAEHDLALLSTLLRKTSEEARGAARFLLDANPHLGRALRFRARRWIRKWTSADGLVDPGSAAKDALAPHQLAARSFSPTALQKFSTCPYQFYLSAIVRLAPREDPDRIEEIDPLQRGGLVHEVQFGVLGKLRDKSLLPVSPETLERARVLLDRELDAVAARHRDELAPAIARVWDDAIVSIRTDLRDWLRRTMAFSEWIPWRFELSFGLRELRDRDPHSRDEAVPLDCGVQLRGSIDLVERRADGALRATDHKTGRSRVPNGAIVAGGAALQPVLYALVLEKMFPDAKVQSGRLYYCTGAGGYAEVDIPLDDYARRTVQDVVTIVGDALARGFFPAAPSPRACEYCDYRAVCGPHEEARVRKKNPDALVSLKRLRSLP